MNKYSRTPLGRIANAFSQLAHTLCLGASGVSISGKVGYKNRESENTHWWWKVLEKFIDIAFLPIDGKGHCAKAYRVDKEEAYHIGEKYKWQTIGCSIFILIFCPVISLVTYSYLLIKEILTAIKKLRK